MTTRNVLKHWKDPRNQTFFGGRGTVSREYSIGPKKAGYHLSHSPIYSIFRPIKKPTQYDPIYAHSPGLIQVDLIDLSGLKQKWKYALQCLDTASRFLSSELLKRKTSEETTAAMKRILDRLPFRPHR